MGALARLYKQRLTSHPSAFVKLAALKEDVVEKSLLDLENHARVRSAEHAAQAGKQTVHGNVLLHRCFMLSMLYRLAK